MDSKKTDRPAGGVKQSFNKNPGSGKPAFGKKPFGDKPAFGKKNFGDKPTFGRKPADGKPAFDKKPAEGKPAAEKKPFTGKKPFGAKNGFSGKPSGEKKPAPNAVTPARMTALRAVFDVYFAETYSNLALDKQLKLTRLSDEDKRLATSIFYLCVENRNKIDYMLAPFVKVQPENIILSILHVAVAQLMFMDRIPAHAAVNEAVNQAKLYKKEEAVQFVNAVLRSLLRAKDAGEVRLPSEEDGREQYLVTEYSASADAVKLLIEAYGYEEAKAILAYRPMSRTETLRPSLLRSSDEELEAFMTNAGWQWEKADTEHAYRVRAVGNPTDTDEYRQGKYSVQGESAMLAALAVEPARGMNILDACAAPGGKSAYICEKMLCSGRVYAWDLHEHRVDLMKQNGKRLSLDNLRCAVRDATVLKEDMVRTMDAVIVDAPCSGLGVMADKPDIKYNLTQDKVDDIVATQKKLLDTCCEYVKQGGLLVYSTCTILPRENEDMVHDFLLNHPEFKPETGTAYLPERLRGLCNDGCIRLLQHRDGVEGFFIARFRRVR